MTWLELADGVFARRYAELDQTLGLVVGTRRCLVIDTGMDEVHGAAHAEEIRTITSLPWTVVITHAHWDHHLGTAAFQPCPVLAHPRCGPAMVSAESSGQADWVRRYRAEGKAELADRVAAARVVPPTELLPDRRELDLGDRVVALLHPGLGHTDHDVVVHVPDAAVLFAGDLVEQGAPPQLGPDAHPADWPSTVDHLLATGAQIIVPGHGNPVDPTFVRTQRDTLTH